jgi:hypothetical protein
MGYRLTALQEKIIAQLRKKPRDQWTEADRKLWNKTGSR